MMPRLRLLLLLLVTTLTIGCSSPLATVDTGDGGIHLPALQSYVFYVDPDVSVDGNYAIDEAVRQWTEYTDVQITVFPGPHVCWEVNCFAIYEVSFADFNSLVDGTYIGYTVPWFIFISNAITSYDELQDTYIHEGGHALGLLHPCQLPCTDYAVMNPAYRAGADRVVCPDVDQFYAERPQIEAGAGAALACTNAPGPMDEAADGGPVLASDAETD